MNLLHFRVQKHRLSATKLPTPPERRKSSIVHADLKAVALEVNGGADSHNGRRKESRSGSLPDIQVGENHVCEIYLNTLIIANRLRDLPPECQGLGHLELR